ncbi:MAG: MerR family transcriptional regulator [Oscillospiraceae bacterium]|nr:MerR family transcriptional regulator [Oscillospiraceae bacterium]
MENYRAIPDGYMRVGELARQAGVTVRALQYYDKQGLLSPSAASEGGFRLYSDRDAVRLMQILALKQMGFSLGEIKQRLSSLDTTEDVLQALTEQTEHLAAQIATLTETHAALQKLKAEIAQMDSVNFKKYAAILTNLQLKNEHYWMIKHFDEDMLDRFSANLTVQDAQRIIAQINRSLDEAHRLHKRGVAVHGKKAQQLARNYWALILEVTGGDLNTVGKLADMFGNINANIGDAKYQSAQAYIGEIIELYLQGEHS